MNIFKMMRILFYINEGISTPYGNIIFVRFYLDIQKTKVTEPLNLQKVNLQKENIQNKKYRRVKITEGKNTES